MIQILQKSFPEFGIKMEAINTNDPDSMIYEACVHSDKLNIRTDHKSDNKFLAIQYSSQCFLKELCKNSKVSYYSELCELVKQNNFSFLQNNKN